MYMHKIAYIPIDLIAPFSELLACFINSTKWVLMVGSPPVKRSFFTPSAVNMSIRRRRSCVKMRVDLWNYSTMYTGTETKCRFVNYGLQFHFIHYYYYNNYYHPPPLLLLYPNTTDGSLLPLPLYSYYILHLHTTTTNLKVITCRPYFKTHEMILRGEIL